LETGLHEEKGIGGEGALYLPEKREGWDTAEKRIPSLQRLNSQREADGIKGTALYFLHIGCCGGSIQRGDSLNKREEDKRSSSILAGTRKEEQP